MHARARRQGAGPANGSASMHSSRRSCAATFLTCMSKHAWLCAEQARVAGVAKLSGYNMCMRTVLRACLFRLHR